MVPEKEWKDYPVNVDVKLSRRVVQLLREAQFKDVEEDPTFDWHVDSIIPSKWMFPSGTPPATIVSMNARFDPIFHVRIGRALRKLRSEGILILCTGGAVHNLYRNNWLPMIRHGDNFQTEKTPAKWATGFEQSVCDVINNNSVKLSQHDAG